MMPYITPLVLQRAPTGIDWTQFPAPGASAQDNLAALTDICWRATDLADAIAGQVLRATLDVEELDGPDFRVTVRPNGVARIIVSRWPVLAVVRCAVSPSAAFPPAWTSVPTDAVHVEYTPIGIPTGAPGGAGAGPAAVLLAPGFLGWDLGRRGYRVQLTYVNGWPHAGLTASVAAGMSSLPIDDITGWAGVTGTIIDGAQTETVTVTGVQPATPGALQGPGILLLSAPTQYAHASGTLVTTLAWSIQQACILLAIWQALQRGSQAVVLPAFDRALQAAATNPDRLYQDAVQLLAPYRRII